DMQAFARRWRDDHRGQWFTVGKLSGFCLLMKREVYAQIGGLDERFGVGVFDDDDLAERARRAGVELGVAHDLFVHHFGSRTFVGNGIDPEKLLNENERRFAAKWGIVSGSAYGGSVVPPKADSVSADALNPGAPGPGNGQQAEVTGPVELRRTRVVLRPWAPPSGGLPPRTRGSTNFGAEAVPRHAERARHVSTVGLQAEPPLTANNGSAKGGTTDNGQTMKKKVSLTIIARDEENNLPRALESVKGLFDEIIVVDTGSKDRTKEVAQDFGARVFDFVWVD